MALEVFFRALNNVRVTIDPNGAGISNSDTDIDLDTGDGASVPNALTPILMTIFDASDEDIFEIIQVDSVAGDTLTVQRGQQDTSAIVWSAGTQIEQRNPAAEVNQFADALTDGNSELEFAALTLGVAGLDVDPGSDIDADLITVGVTGSPTLSWVEGIDRFDFSKGLRITGLITVTGSITSGLNDNTPGVFTAHGDAAASVTGGQFVAATAADHDTTIASYGSVVNEDDLFIGPDTNPDLLKLHGADGLFEQTAGNTKLAGVLQVDTLGPKAGTDQNLVTLADNLVTANGNLFLHAAANPKLRVAEAGSGTSHFEFEDVSTSAGTVRKTNASGASTIRLEPIVSNGTSAAQVQLFRLTSTSGARELVILKGDGSATTVHTLSAASTTIFNTQAESMDFIIRGIGKNNALRIQGSDGFLGLNTAAPQEQLHVTGNAIISGNVSVDGGTIDSDGGASPLTLDTTTVRMLGGVLYLDETTTPTPIDSVGALYTKSDNGLWFQDGDGNEHIVHLPAFSSIGFHTFNATSADTTLTNQNEFNQFLGFENVGPEDPSGFAVGSSANDEIVLSATAGGVYDISYTFSVDVTGTNQSVIMALACELSTPLTITDASNADPIVITTSSAHELSDGDAVTISGLAGAQATGNGDRLVDVTGATTYAIYDLAGSSVAGAGAYTSGGTVDVVYPHQLIAHQLFPTTALDTVTQTGRREVPASSTLNLVFANITSSAKIAEVIGAGLTINRVDNE